jgi:hypothetical protein
MRWKQWMGTVAVMWVALAEATGQGFIVDQASGDLIEPVVNGLVIPQNDLAQSFTPSLSAVGFLQLRTLNAAGATVTVVVNLRAGSLNGPVISSTDPVVIVNFSSLGTFYFPDNIPVTPGQLYFFQPVLQSAGRLSIGFKDSSTYDRGEPWINGASSGPDDVWFREGIVVPEPGVVVLLVMGAGALILWRHNRSTTPN